MADWSTNSTLSAEVSPSAAVPTAFQYVRVRSPSGEVLCDEHRELRYALAVADGGRAELDSALCAGSRRQGRALPPDRRPLQRALQVVRDERVLADPPLLNEVAVLRDRT